MAKSRLGRLGGIVICVGLLVGLGASCGGGGADTACQKVGRAFCDRACACTEGPGCAISNNGLSLTFDSPSDCQGIMVTFACAGGAKGYNDAEACLPLVQAAMCTGSGTEAALAGPTDPACEAPPQN